MFSGSFSLNALAVDPATLPKVLFVDVRSIEEALFVGSPDGLASFGIMHYNGR